MRLPKNRRNFKILIAWKTSQNTSSGVLPQKSLRIGTNYIFHSCWNICGYLGFLGWVMSELSCTVDSEKWSGNKKAYNCLFFICFRFPFRIFALNFCMTFWFTFFVNEFQFDNNILYLFLWTFGKCYILRHFPCFDYFTLITNCRKLSNSSQILKYFNVENRNDEIDKWKKFDNEWIRVCWEKCLDTSFCNFGWAYFSR